MKCRLYIGLLIVLAASCVRDAPLPAPHVKEGEPARFAVADTMVTAGAGLDLHFRQVGDREVSAAVMTSYGPVLLPPSFAGEKGFFKIDPLITSQAGVIEVFLIQERRVTDTVHINVIPGPAKGFIETYAGPRSLTAGSSSPAMAIAVPLDRFGNLLQQGQTVRLAVRTPGEGDREENVALVDGAAHIYIYPGNTPGSITSGARSGKAVSLEERINIVPGPTAGFELYTEQSSSAADGRELSGIIAGPLEDIHGHRMVDGSFVRFFLKKDEELFAVYESKSIGGFAGIQLEHPDQAAELEVSAVTGNTVSSNIERLMYQAEIKSIEWDYDEAMQVLRIGPLSGSMGHYLADGIRVRLFISGDQKALNTSLYLENGSCAFDIGKMALPEGKYEMVVEAAGLERKMELTLK